ncbi:putative protein in type-1 retrotransposable element R1DM [Chionoecetes opilio]|uniref:Reverse transcriptase domain-containing protein n=1 Tax=Chionoecetes opilio TaxID=41210 RepID=A0A8J5BT81_CHIOP|nr:putative protein in type-1 retrotransposable element R1DM [Chionoecetes opilio]
MGTAECLSTLLCAASSGGTTVAFLDLEKAFELANCTVILSLLVHKGVCGKLLIWLRDFLSGRAARVALQGETSQLHQHKNGTPPGSILSPFLFNILMEELISLPLPPGTKLLCYADDLALYCTGPAHAQRAQNLLTDITTKCRELGLKLNVAKSKAMTFGCDAPRAPLYILDTLLAWVTSHQYLGIWLDNRLNLRTHVAYLQERENSRISVLRAITGLKGGASFQVKRTFYIHAIHFLLDYSAPCLISLTNTLHQKLEATQNSALRVIINAPDGLRSATCSRSAR